MSGFETVVRGSLRLKRQSEALVADEKRRKKKKKKANKEEDAAGPAVADLPPDLANDPAAVAAAAAIREGKKKPGDALETDKDRSATSEREDTQSPKNASQDRADRAVDTPENDGEEERERKTSESRSRSRESSKPGEASLEDIEALLAGGSRRWTKAEKAFYLARKAREAERVNKQLQLTHRQRMEKFNQHLASLSEHFDQPRVGPG